MKLPALVLSCLGAAALGVAPARAAFELTDASPAALGAVSLEESAEPMAPAEARGLRVGTSHASLFETAELAAERIQLEAPVPGGRGAASWTIIRAPGARESSASLAWSRGAGSPLGIGLRVERLDFTADGASALGGFAVGGGAIARLATERVSLEGSCAADRLLRSEALERAGVRPALTVGAGCSAGGARIRYAERWEVGGERSPRLTLDFPLGASLRARFGRGGAPGRIGAALAASIGRLEVSWGRLDFASGGTITAVGLAWTERARSPHPVHEPPAPPSPRAGGGESRAEHPRGGPRAAALLALWPFVIMRRCGRIRRLGSGFAAIVTGSCLAAAPARADSSAVWLPAPREDVEVVERLDEPPAAASIRGAVLARFARGGDGTWRIRRLSAAWERSVPPARRRARAVELSAIEAGGRPRPTLAISGAGVRVAAGRLTLERAPWLLSRSLGLARSFARVAEARAVPVGAVAPAGASTPAAGGIAVEGVGRRVRSWALAGRGVEGGRLVGTAGAMLRGRTGDAALGIGRCGTRWFLSTAGAWRSRRAAASAELLLGAGRPALSASAATRGSDVTLWCRWRFLAGEARPVAGEAGAVTRGRFGSARLTWRAWTPAARADNGALELEAATALGPGRPIRARAGERPGGAGTAGSAEPASLERYALLDATLVTHGLTSLAFLASGRRGAGGTRTRRMLGARLRSGRENASRVTLLVQASRTGTGPSALGSELNASGQSTLAERTRSGIVFAARGVARCGPLELGGVWEREEGAEGARPRSASAWVRWFL
jgi:hypothetical protein